MNQICSICGNRFHSPISPEVKRWFCPECGTVHDRNFNAAKNILAEGVRQLNSLPLDEESLPEKNRKISGEPRVPPYAYKMNILQVYGAAFRYPHA